MASDTSRPTDGSTATGTPETDDAAGSVATDRATTTGSTGTDSATTDTPDTPAADTTATPADSATTGTATTGTGTTTGGAAAAPVRTGSGTAADTTSTPASATTSGGGLAGAGAVVAAGLGLASLTGTSVGDMLRERESLVGQIQAATGSPGDTIESFYGAPWDVAAVVNGVVALVAVLVGLVLVLGPAARPAAGAWVRPVALGGLVLGVLGLLVSGGMYLDLFASTPVLPQMPGIPGLGG
ncbi:MULTISPECIES: hypothetical protein [unclassified Pseudonocardia]|uniref:hypothetical protein n=1 Tax=unclassified Pseudonocardia TaxID=2619320 RepID=UPI001CF6709D|nr:hypothetical protein [Pseudonocardia sp. ICBG601]